MAPLGRILAQIIVPIVATLARAVPAAYAQAVQNAKKGGAEAAAKSGSNAFGKAKMSLDEALMVLNLTKADVKQLHTPATVEKIEQQFEKYFAANDIQKGGSFYLQSKVYRAKELLEEYQIEKRREEQQQSQQSQQQQQDTKKD
eukprot:CAMPEP_0195283970 /NCGR_PEP_ID=MMETSP0707-20130614/2339_1 /TAXON_ID=33640 /ORGANISM="Asterionellopsis glacialis, Strain CCMP134" /LENGTH=143 /DNA_ID=CAMNT_0040343235 /DNA_START=249 /DNA_END=680 /DNA_ORIENTATION=+